MAQSEFLTEAPNKPVKTSDIQLLPKYSIPLSNLPELRPKTADALALPACQVPREQQPRSPPSPYSSPGAVAGASLLVPKASAALALRPFHAAFCLDPASSSLYSTKNTFNWKPCTSWSQRWAIT